MDNKTTKYVLGQRVTLCPTKADYDLIIGESPAGSKGPPPHKHSKFYETFLITEGELEFFVNGHTMVCKAGGFVDIPQGTLHTFNNVSDKPCIWVNIHSPKGFSKFFETFGIPENEENAISKSLDPNLIQQVLQTAKDYDMAIPAQKSA